MFFNLRDILFMLSKQKRHMISLSFLVSMDIFMFFYLWKVPESVKTSVKFVEDNEADRFLLKFMYKQNNVM